MDMNFTMILTLLFTTGCQTFHSDIHKDVHKVCFLPEEIFESGPKAIGEHLHGKTKSEEVSQILSSLENQESADKLQLLYKAFGYPGCDLIDALSEPVISNQ